MSSRALLADDDCHVSCGFEQVPVLLNVQFLGVATRSRDPPFRYQWRPTLIDITYRMHRMFLFPLITYGFKVPRYGHRTL